MEELKNNQPQESNEEPVLNTDDSSVGEPKLTTEDPSVTETENTPPPVQEAQASPSEPHTTQEPTLPPTKKADPKDVEENRVFGILSYIWVLCFVALFAKSDSPYVKFHAKQGVVLFIVWAAGFIIAEIFGSVSYGLRNVLMSANSLFVLVMAIIGIMHAYHGNLEKLPIIGQYANKLNL